MITMFWWMSVMITIFFFIAVLVIFVCLWITYFRVERTMLEQKKAEEHSATTESSAVNGSEAKI